MTSLRPLRRNLSTARRPRGFRPGFELLEDRATPAIYNVVGALDGVGFVVPTGGDTFNASTLRAAILAANASEGVDDVINLSAGSYNLFQSGSGDDGDLDITDNLEIHGDGAATTFLDAAMLGDRIFDIDECVTVHITGLTLGNADVDSCEGGGAIRNAGDLTLDDVNVMNNVLTSSSGDALGGGIYNSGTLHLVNSMISGNEANGDNGYDARGGGIYNTGTLDIDNSTITDNQANGASGSDTADGLGGGIFNACGTVTITLSTLSGNEANGGDACNNGDGGDGEGGAIYNDGGGCVTITSTTLADNSATGGDGGYCQYDDGGEALGGAIRNRGHLDIESSTLSGNEAQGGSTDGNNGGDAKGGAIDNTGDLTLTNATISGNQAMGGQGGFGWCDVGGNAEGGGVANVGCGTATIANSTITLNEAEGGCATIHGSSSGGGVADCTDSVQVVSSIIAGNTADEGPDVKGDFDSLGYNLIGLANGKGGNGFDEETDLTGDEYGGAIDPMLTPLQDNGGPTLTHALLQGSSAIGAGANPYGLETDQRGVARTTLGRVDIGAVQNVATNLDNVLGLYVDDALGFAQDFFGGDEKWLRGETNSFGNDWYFITPDGDLYEWDGTAGLNGNLLAALGADVHIAPEKLYNASNLQLDPSVVALAQTLDATLGLHVDGAGFYHNTVTGEKWLRGEVNSFGNHWYIIKADGEFLEWDGVEGSLTGNSLGNFGVAAHLSPELLYKASNVTLGATEAALAQTLDEAHGFTVDARGYFENAFGGNEKWLRGNVNSFGNDWYYILPTGEVFEWDGTDGQLSGTSLGTLGADAFLNTELVHDAAAFVLPPEQQDAARALDLQYGFYQDQRGLFDNRLGMGERWLRGEENSFGNRFYFIKPSGELYEWDGATGGNLIFTFDAAVYLSPELLSDAFA